ncbi:MAG: EAL domain-containing protein [Myxococcota bacterium]
MPSPARFNARLTSSVALLVIVLLGIGLTSLWAFEQLEQISTCAGEAATHCRELARAQLGRVRALQGAFVALSTLGCLVLIWSAAEVLARFRALRALADAPPRDGVPAAESFSVTVNRQAEDAPQRDSLGERIETVLALRKVTDQDLAASLQTSGKFAVANVLTDDPPPIGRVLLVDDEPEVLRGFARVLKARGHEVVTAARGAEAIVKLSERPFDVVVSDISMPDMDGLQLLKEVRRRDLLVPVILATGSPAVKTAAEAVDNGAFQYLIKPIQNENLRQVVEHGIRVSRIARVKQEAAELLGRDAALGADHAGLEVSLDRALDTLWIAFQPIVNVKTRTVHAFESLLRSNEPALPHPNAVLDAAERLGRLDALGRIVREKAAREAVEAPEVRLFVNLHVRDLLDPNLSDPDAALSKIANRVVLEITERSSLEDVRDARLRVAALRELGFRIAVDDMGAGYAGLSSFALLEPDVVKLDMSLIRDVHRSATKRRVIRSLIELSKGMGIEVVAEGVETAEERDVLIELGCELLQGYLFAKPGKPFPSVAWGTLAAPDVRAATE